MPPTVALAGDTMLGRTVGERLGRSGHRLLAAEVRELAGAADLFIANLECRISDRGERIRALGKPFYFRAPPVAAQWLVKRDFGTASPRPIATPCR
jgi:Bacterial capsule synthesis protein PGA_cap